MKQQVNMLRFNIKGRFFYGDVIFYIDEII